MSLRNLSAWFLPYFFINYAFALYSPYPSFRIPAAWSTAPSLVTLAPGCHFHGCELRSMNPAQG
jgi:hypothetical protein